MRRAIGWTASLVVVACALAACGDAEQTQQPTPSPTPTRGSSSAPHVPLAARDFAWADGDNLLNTGATITVVRGVNPAQALAVVAPDAVTPTLSVQQARQFAELRGSRYQVVAARSRSGCTYVVEDNGFAATDGAVLRALSRRGPTTVLYTSINADMTFLYGRHGRLVRSFDPLLGSSDVGRRLRQERGLPFGSEAAVSYPRALSMTLTRRLTGCTARSSDVAYGFTGYTRAVVVRS